MRTNIAIRCSFRQRAFFQLAIVILICLVGLLQFESSQAGQEAACLSRITSRDALLVADSEGHIIIHRNKDKKCVPASTWKILTGLAAIHHLGPSYRFHTEFYLDNQQNLKVKGYGDPLLISEVWQQIADHLAAKVRNCRNLILDDTYFADEIIPGVGSSTNPYDAPNGALCANFNTVFFKLDKRGRIVSAEPQTPLTPLAQKKIRLLGLKQGRYAFSQHGHDTARYAGEILVHFLEQSGMVCQGELRTGAIQPGDSLVYTYYSTFTLGEALQRMFEFSNNFMANQILIAVGAHVYGSPGTLAKGVRVLSDYCREVLHLRDIEVAEGSGISRGNRASPLDMLAVLKRFAPYRTLLVRKGNVFYKTGSLRGVSARAGYIEDRSGNVYYFVVFLNRSCPDIDSIVDCVKKSLDNG